MPHPADPHGWNQQKANIIANQQAVERARREGRPSNNISEGGAWGAIAYSGVTQRYSWSATQADEATAKARAIRECDSPGATALVWGNDVYLALAVAEGGYYGSAWNAKQKIAERDALGYCASAGRPGRIVLSFHT